MPRATRQLLEDVIDSGQFIMDSTAGVTEHEFMENRLLRNATERNFEIVGEALSRLARQDPQILSLIPDYREIIGLRSIIAHGYDEVDASRLWAIVNHDLPGLIARVRALRANQ